MDKKEDWLPPHLPLRRQCSSPVYLFGELEPETALQLHKFTPLQFKRNEAVPDASNTVPRAVDGDRSPVLKPAGMTKSAVSLADVMREQLEGGKDGSSAQRKPQSSYLRATVTTMPAVNNSLSPAASSKVGPFGVHTYAKIAFRSPDSRKRTISEASDGSLPTTDTSAASHAPAAVAIAVGPTGRLPQSYESRVAADRPRLLSDRIPSMPAGSAGGKELGTGRTLPLKKSESSADSDFRDPKDGKDRKDPFLRPFAGVLLRALSGLSEDGPARPTLPPPTFGMEREGSLCRQTSTSSTRSKPDALASSVVKLSRMYSVSLMGKDDIMFTAALERGPPYARPHFLMSRFTPVLKPEAMDRLKEGITAHARSVLDEPNAGGNSENSEALSVEILAACQSMQLWASEMQISYATSSPIIDYIAIKKLPRAAVETVFTPPSLPAPPSEKPAGRPAMWPAAKGRSTDATVLHPSDRKKYRTQTFANSAFFSGQRYEHAHPGRVTLVEASDAPLLGAQSKPEYDDVLVGVSVTRAMKYVGGPDAFTFEDAEKLLTKKLGRLLLAREGVDPSQRWTRQILHVWAESQHVADVLRKVLQDPLRTPPRLWESTIILCTIAPASTMHRIIFKNDHTFAELPDMRYDPRLHDMETARMRREGMMHWAVFDGHCR